MDYYRLTDNIKCPGRWYLDEISDVDNWIFSNGSLVDVAVDENLVVQINQLGVPMDFTTTDAYNVPIVSENFLSCIAMFLGEVQVLPVSVPKQNELYFILIVTNKIDCVDEAQSDYQKFESGNAIRPDLAGEYQSFTRLKIDESKATKPIFRIDKFDIAMVVSEEIKTCLENCEVTGCQFELIT